MAIPTMQRLLWRQVARTSSKHIIAGRTTTTTTPLTTASFRTSSSPTSPIFRSVRNNPPSRRAYSTEPPKSTGNQVKFWPFLVIIAAGTGGYVLLANRRKG